mmetsp:Transcript_9962/g.21008  ORF Transcript_9962/g.21008 Transcript_9962/m.21008 type:complete len:97 (+) Transcript_9962:608-898(+)
MQKIVSSCKLSLIEIQLRNSRYYNHSTLSLGNSYLLKGLMEPIYERIHPKKNNSIELLLISHHSLTVKVSTNFVRFCQTLVKFFKGQRMLIKEASK